MLNLNELSNFHIQEMKKINLDEILKSRLILVLNKAKIDGEDDNDMIKNYEEALSIAPKRYSVVLKRDIDEINVNNYNPEWIMCWDGNIDIQPCLDFFGVITYITDYYMKDDSGTLTFIKDVLDKSNNASMKEKLNLVKNTFLTHRQIGESEAYYKLFQHLHLSHSNISAVFAPTGFKKNRSRFLEQITEEQACHSNNVIEVEDKEGKYYIEKKTMMDKLLKKPLLLKFLTYSQFVKRFSSTKTVPMNYNYETDMKTELSQTHIDNGDYIFTDEEPTLGQRGIKLPRYFPIETDDGTEWMMLRRPLALRLHKFKRRENAHEFYYSEMQLYFHFDKEEELYPEDFKQCFDKYKENEAYINAVKRKVMKYLAQVQEGREHAENILANEIANIMDANKEQNEEEDILEGIHEHPEMFVKEPTGLIDNIEPTAKHSNKIYRKIELQNEEDINSNIHRLDKDQRIAVDIGIDYAKKCARIGKNKCRKPNAPLVIVLFVSWPGNWPIF